MEVILSQIKQAVCLTLDKRIEEFDRIKTEWKNIDINVELFLCGDGILKSIYNRIDDKILPPIYNETINYPTWLNRSATYDAWKCHKQIFTDFYRNYSDGYLLILEDDAKMEEDFEEILTKVEPYFKTRTFDLLNFGAYLSKPYTETDNPHVIKLDGRGGGLHCCMLSRRLCKNLSEMLPLGPYDWMIEQYWQNRYPCYAIYPGIVTQKDGFSFIEGHELSKPDRWKK